VEKRLALFATHLRVGIAEDETDGGEEIALSRTIATNDDVRTGGEGLDDGLVLVAVQILALRRWILERDDFGDGAPLEALDDDLFDIHDDNNAASRAARLITMSESQSHKEVRQSLAI
jgi:hypothetical protein